MQLVEQTSATQPPIDAVGDRWLTISGERWERSVMLAPERVQAWDCHALDALDMAAFQAAIELKPEVLLLATGTTLRFPAASLRLQMQAQGLGLEVMDHRGAARTYNLLVAEGRRVAALFLIESSAAD